MRTYDESKLHDAYAVFKEVFQSDMSYETFVHKHVENPEYMGELANLVYYENGLAKGTNSFMGQMFLYGQEEIFALQSCDTAVLPETRGKGVFSSLIRQALETVRENKIPFLFGLPNQNSYPGFVKLGLLEVGRFSSYFAIYHPFKFLWGRLMKRAAPSPLFQETSLTDRLGNRWTVSLRCPFSDADFTLMNRQPGIHVRRNWEYFHWKADYLPKGVTAYFCCRENETLLSYFVVRVWNGRATVLDWMLPQKEPTAALNFIHRVLRRYANYAVIYLVNPEGRDAVAFRRSAFMSRKDVSTPLMVYFTSAPNPAFTDFQNWRLRFIDADTVLNG